MKIIIKDIMGDVECPKGYICCNNNFIYLCKAKDIGLETHLLCLDETEITCKFSIAFDNCFYCKCPLRIYIKKHIESK